jgi:predicted TIM-barrel fold metal-dependent hydrolase
MATMIIDTDSHVIEPVDLWTSRLPKSWGDRVMHVKWNEQAGADMWYIGDQPIFRAWAGAMWGWDQPFPSSPATLAEAQPAAYDVGERVKAMDAGGLGMAVLYPGIAGTFVDPFVKDPGDTSLAHVKAYNDFVLDWAREGKGRFVPLAVVPYWDVPAAVEEIQRAVSTGHHGFVMTGAPHLHDQPYLADRHWDLLWSACQETGLPVSFHVANGDLSSQLAPARIAVDGAAVTYARTTQASFLDNGQQLNDLLMGGLLARFPDLKFIIVESGIGWIPFLLESSDYHFKKARVDREHPEFGDLLPSDLFHRQVWANYWFERLEPWHVDAVGEDHILFETDFPHPTCLYGQEVSDAINSGLTLQPERVQQKILWQNAASLFKLDLPADAAA